MKVFVRFFPSLRRILNVDKLEVDLPERASINDLLDELSRRFGKKFLESLYISDLGITTPIHLSYNRWKNIGVNEV